MFRRGWEVFAENRLALVGLGFVIFILLFCFVGPLIYKTQQVSATLTRLLLHAERAHLLGCDNLGYDELGRLMVGGQNSLEVGLAAAFVSCLFGSIYGAVSGFAGGIVDSFMMRIVDAMLSIPFIFVLIILAVLIHPRPTLIGFIAVTYWPRPARLVRGETLSLRTREYVPAVKVGRPAARARCCGTSCRTPSARSSCRLRSPWPTRSSSCPALASSASASSCRRPTGARCCRRAQLPTVGRYWWLIYPAGHHHHHDRAGFNFIGDALRDAFETRLQRR